MCVICSYRFLTTCNNFPDKSLYRTPAATLAAAAAKAGPSTPFGKFTPAEQQGYLETLNYGMSIERTEDEADREYYESQQKTEENRYANEKKMEEERYANEKKIEEERYANERKIAEERHANEKKKAAERKVRFNQMMAMFTPVKTGGDASGSSPASDISPGDIPDMSPKNIDFDGGARDEEAADPNKDASDEDSADPDKESSDKEAADPGKESTDQATDPDKEATDVQATDPDEGADPNSKATDAKEVSTDEESSDEESSNKVSSDEVSSNEVSSDEESIMLPMLSFNTDSCSDAIVEIGERLEFIQESTTAQAFKKLVKAFRDDLPASELKKITAVDSLYVFMVALNADKTARRLELDYLLFNKSPRTGQFSGFKFNQLKALCASMGGNVDGKNDNAGMISELKRVYYLNQKTNKEVFTRMSETY